MEEAVRAAGATPATVGVIGDGCGWAWSLRRLRQRGGVLVACPCPAEQALEPSEVDQATTRALRDATAKGVQGKVLTPWLLASVTKTLGPRTIVANHALLLNNVRVAARSHPARPQRHLDIPDGSLITIGPAQRVRITPTVPKWEWL